MKVAVLQFFSWPDRRIPLDQVYHRAFQRIEIMDRNGYDAVWLAEHHFSSFSICPSIHIMGAHVAARTKNLRIGTGVSLAPFYNPLRLAEEVALLDVLSGGRVNWGVGRGYQEGEFKAFGVEPQESYEVFREHVQAVIGAWTRQRLTFEGQALPVRRRRGAAETGAAAAPAGVAGCLVARGDELGGRERVLNHARPPRGPWPHRRETGPKCLSSTTRDDGRPRSSALERTIAFGSVRPVAEARSKRSRTRANGSVAGTMATNSYRCGPRSAIPASHPFRASHPVHSQWTRGRQRVLTAHGNLRFDKRNSLW